MDAPAHPPTLPDPPVASAPGQVVGELPCIRCGYNLDGRPLASPCPECGSDVAASLASLYFADAAYLSRLRSGVILLAAASEIGPMLSILSMATGAFNRGPSLWFGAILASTGPILAYIGTARFVTPRTVAPKGNGPRPDGSLLSLAAFVYMLLFIFSGFTIAITERMGGNFSRFVWFGLMTLAGEAWCFRNFLFATYASRLFQLGCRPRLVSFFRLSRFWIGATAVFIALGSLTAATLSFTGSFGAWAGFLIGGMYLSALPWILIAWPTLLILSAGALSKIKRRVQERPPVIRLEADHIPTEMSPG